MRDERTATNGGGGVMTAEALEAGYALPNEWQHARRRLELLELSYDPLSTRRLEHVGVRAGWRCLEVGAGGGSITRWLSRAVGPTGTVVAVDLDTRFVEELDADNVDARCLDVVRDGLPEGPFDFVHSRAVLVHIPEREAVLAQLVECLRPGGRLLLEEPDSALLLDLTTGVYGKAWRSITAALHGAGMTLDWPRGLPTLLQRHGLVEIEADCHVPHVNGRSDLARFIQLSWVQLRERALAAGATAQVLDEAGALLDDPTRWFTGIPLNAVWGRRPA